MTLTSMVRDGFGDVPAVTALGGTGRRLLSLMSSQAMTGSGPDALLTGNQSWFHIPGTGWGRVDASMRDPGGLIRGILAAVLLVGLLAIPAMAVPVLVLSPSAGAEGARVSTTGSSFDLDAFEFARATLLFDGTPVVTYIPFTGSGFSTLFEVPSGTSPGIHTVRAVGPLDDANASFTVILPPGPGLLLSPSAGRAGTVVMATGDSFSLSGERLSWATILFNSTPIVRAVPLTRNGTLGSFSTSFTVPANTTPGDYPVRAVGPQDSAEAVFTVTNLAPWAQIDVDPWSGRAPLSVHFSGMRSYDEDGSISSYLWDFGDGTSMTGETVDHTFASPGEYRTTLTVTDDQGRSGSAPVAISVERAPPVVNSPPVAGITVLPQRGSVPLTVRLDGSQSYDVDDGDLAYFWDCGDGVSEMGVTTWHTFEREGTYRLSLMVTDPRGASDRAEATVEVEPPFPWWLVVGGFGMVAGGLIVRSFLRSSRTALSSKLLPPKSRVPEPPVRIGIQSGMVCSTRRESGLVGITVDVRSGIRKEEETMR